jgi:hypothetical protein
LTVKLAQALKLSQMNEALGTVQAGRSVVSA